MAARPAAPLVIAHRGASAYRPENTLSAYQLAVQHSADMIELDLHLTRDEAIVVSHDADLGHFGESGRIGDLSLAEVKELDAGHGWERPEAVPTLDEVLDAYGEIIPFNIEIKSTREGDYTGLEAAALQAVERRGLLERTVFSSFADTVLAELRRLSPRARLAVLTHPRITEPLFERAAAVGAEAVNPQFVMVTGALVAEAHAADLAVYSYTVDEEAQMRRMLDLGVDGLFTNKPDVMRALVPKSD